MPFIDSVCQPPPWIWPTGQKFMYLLCFGIEFIVKIKYCIVIFYYRFENISGIRPRFLCNNACSTCFLREPSNLIGFIEQRIINKTARLSKFFRNLRYIVTDRNILNNTFTEPFSDN